ncbi:hypothetical protein NUSPORA_01741 [Nucleospora cyclopteri]
MKNKFKLKGYLINTILEKTAKTFFYSMSIKKLYFNKNKIIIFILYFIIAISKQFSLTCKSSF